MSLSPWLHVTISVFVAACIGGITNYLAIRMLFHPRQPWLIGRWRVPFTPGLIPKRKLEIARSLGHIVGEYLVTSEGLAAVIQENTFKDKIQRYVEHGVHTILTSQDTLRELALRVVTEKQLSTYKHRLSKGMEQVTTFGIEWLWDRKHQERLRDVIPGWTVDRKQDIVAKLVHYLMSELTQELQSPALDRWLHRSVRDLMGQTSGMVGVIAGLFVDEAKIVHKMKLMIEQKLQSAEVHALLLDFIHGKILEWEEKHVHEVVAIIVRFIQEEQARKPDSDDESMGDRLNSKKVLMRIDKMVGQLGSEDEILDSQDTLHWLIAQSHHWFRWGERLDDILERPIHQLSNERLNEWISNNIPRAVEVLLSLLATNVGKALAALDLPRMVESQVQHFPIERLEDVVLSVSGREFKAITWLGALLGGLIGLSQAILLRL